MKPQYKEKLRQVVLGNLGDYTKDSLLPAYVQELLTYLNTEIYTDLVSYNLVGMHLTHLLPRISPTMRSMVVGLVSKRYWQQLSLIFHH